MRSSKELPDDVGSVFVTAVPGSKFQVVGRRDPANGELCAGMLVLNAAGKLPHSGVEAVTGPEAERLLAEMIQAATMQAHREGMTLDAFMLNSPNVHRS
jgi:hypothetical protein